MIGFSPRGAIDLTIVFPVMFVIGLALDILGLFTIVGGTLLNVIGIFTIGLWILLRSGGGQGVKDSKQPAAKEGAETTAKEGAETTTKSIAKTEAKTMTKTATKGASRLGGAILRVGATSLVEFIPAVNAVFFGWTLMVIWEFVSDFKNFSIEAGD